MTERSGLERVVLGLVWKRGPITPYAIRQEFLTSPTPHFSGSAGAIYPLLRRLERDGLLSSKSERQGKRRCRQYRITPTGRVELKRWLKPPVATTDAMANFDPLRTQIHFLGGLTLRERRAFFEDAIDALEAQLPVADAYEKRHAAARDVFGRLAGQGLRKSLQFRISWLKSVRSALQDQGLV